MARGEGLEDAEVPRWGVWQVKVIDQEETEQLEGVDAEKVVEVEVVGRWYHRRLQVASPQRPVRLLIPVKLLGPLIRGLEQREDW